MFQSLLKLTLVSCLLATANRPSLGQEAPRLLPFQGQLTNQKGEPVPDGVKLIQFKIYDQPTSGNTLWAGEVHRTTVNGGLVNVLLGTKTPLPSSVDSGGSMFNGRLYLEITVDINGDDAITLADPPMLPRQVILPALFATESGDSRKLGGVPAEVILAALSAVVPVGSVLPFYGDPSSLPSQWMLCDGRVVGDPDSPLFGSAVPDLRQVFLRGAGAESPLGSQGGRDFRPPHKHQHPHEHAFTTDDSFLNGDRFYNVFIECCGGNYVMGGNDSSDLKHAHSGATLGPKESATSSVSTSMDYPSETDPALDNRPRFVSVNYIMRVR